MSRGLLMSSIAGLCVLTVLGTALSGRTPALPPTALATVTLTLREGSVDELRAAPKHGRKQWLRVTFDDGDAGPVIASASRRGFSAWHHGRTKPSLRIKQKQAAAANGAPEFVELSRPEDPLALCNWLPDQLSDSLGLLHEYSQPVRLVLNGRQRGVYLRSLRPGDDLAAAAGRARGTFFKGDSLGQRSHLDLWKSAHSWRLAGVDDPRAQNALSTMLEALRQPPSADSLRRLADVLDFEAMARAQAVAALTASIHADRVHNHVLFFDPTRDRLEPLLWDANGFGIHAEANLAVDVMRHPLAERLACDPRFVHRRNEVLWELLHGAGSSRQLIATADEHFERLASTLRHDPEIARLVLRRGVFEVDPVGFEQLDGIRDAFATFVRQRERFLTAHFAGAAATVDPVPDHPEQTLVTVFGTVAVRIARDDGAPVRATDGREAGLLLPGLSTQLSDIRQHRRSDGRGVSAPFAESAQLTYVVDCPAEQLVIRNAFTGKRIETTMPICSGNAPADRRSVHPWDFPIEPSPNVSLGPGTVVIAQPLQIDPDSHLRIVPGTRVVLHALAGIRCFGTLQARGTPEAPIEIVATPASRGIACFGAKALFADTTFVDETPWQGAPATTAPLLSLANSMTKLINCRFVQAAANAIEITGGEVAMRDCTVQRCQQTALIASAGAKVQLTAVDLLFARRAMLVRDNALVAHHDSTLRGNRTGVLAERSARAFEGGNVVLDGVTFTETLQSDVVADPFSSVRLIDTRASVSPVAAPPR